WFRPWQFFALVERHSARATLPKGAQGAGQVGTRYGRRNLRRCRGYPKRIAELWQLAGSHTLFNKPEDALRASRFRPRLLRHERTSGRFLHDDEGIRAGLRSRNLLERSGSWNRLARWRSQAFQAGQKLALSRGC